MKYTAFLMSLIASTCFAVVANPTSITSLISGRVQQVSEAVKKQRRYILTGGPCVGKTSIINHLKSLGHTVVHEAATDVIKDLQAQGNPEPWKDVEFDLKISNCIYARQIESTQNPANLIFFDRGPVDPIAYACYHSFPVHPVMVQRVEDILLESFYETIVFLISPLIEELYENSTVRYEDRETSEKLGEHLAQNYEALGFRIERVPFGTIQERAQWILDYVHQE